MCAEIQMNDLVLRYTRTCDDPSCAILKNGAAMWCRGLNFELVGAVALCKSRPVNLQSAIQLLKSTGPSRTEMLKWTTVSWHRL